MSTWRKLISDVRGLHKLLSTDNLITDRVIKSEINNIFLTLVKRETNLRKLWATDTIFTTIPCLQLKEVDISECCNYVDGCSIARSVYQLPKIAEGNYQYLIQGVYSINAMSGKGTKIKEISINRYLNLLKLPIIKNEIYFWINNNYLYITNPNLQAVRFSALFEEDVPNEIMFPEDNGCGCSNISDNDYCKNPLDKESPIPGYLEEAILTMCSQRLLSTYFKLKTDMTSDGVDSQAVNTKPTN